MRTKAKRAHFEAFPIPIFKSHEMEFMWPATAYAPDQTHSLRAAGVLLVRLNDSVLLGVVKY